MNARTLGNAFDFTRRLARRRRFLTACLLSALAACAAVSTHTKGAAKASASHAPSASPLTLAASPLAPAAPAQTPPPSPSPTPIPAPPWKQPTRPNTTYLCDWSRPGGAKGVSEIRFEYTRQLPQNGWVGKLYTKYKSGATLTSDIQFYGAQPAPRLGTEWGFQTTDGKAVCKVTVSRLGSEVRFGKCSTGVEQYCVNERLLEVYDARPDPGCDACKGQNVFDKVSCLARCLNGGDASAGLACDSSPVGCFVFNYGSQLIFPPLNDIITERGLNDLRQSYIDFVNKALGPCTSSHLCPFGAVCGLNGACERWY